MTVDLTRTYLADRKKVANMMLAMCDEDKQARYESELAMIAEIERLRNCVATMREKLEAIVCTEGEDAGVVLLSQDGPTEWSETLQCHVYKHLFFSPLGDALIELYKLTEATDQCPT